MRRAMVTGEAGSFILRSLWLTEYSYSVISVSSVAATFFTLDSIQGTRSRYGGRAPVLVRRQLEHLRALGSFECCVSFAPSSGRSPSGTTPPTLARPDRLAVHQHEHRVGVARREDAQAHPAAGLDRHVESHILLRAVGDDLLSRRRPTPLTTTSTGTLRRLADAARSTSQ